MTSPRPFQLMVASRGAPDDKTVTEQARWAESVGFTHIATHDHLANRHAVTPLLAAIGAVTERIGLVPLVYNNDLRHPAVLAQELASIDVLSGGRLVVGLGAGWNEPEYDAIGLPFDKAGTRIDRMLEAIAIMRGLFADGRFSYEGRFYTITDMDGGPKPIQKPPPFLIGGTRERVLRLAAQHGDIVGIDLRSEGEAILDAFEARMDVRVGWIRDAAGADRLPNLDLNVLRSFGGLVVTDNALKVAGDVARELEAATGQEISARDVLESPFAMIGSVPELVDRLKGFRQRWGINSFLVGWLGEPGVRDFAPVVEQLSGS